MCKIIYIWIPLLTTITRNVENKYETPKSCRFRRRRCSMISFCMALCMLTKVHSSRAVDKIISVSHRAGRGAEPMQTSLETPKRANTGAECPKLLTHSLIHESLCPSLPHDLALPLLFPYSASLLREHRFHPWWFARLRPTTGVILRGLLSRGLTAKEKEAIVMMRKSWKIFWPKNLPQWLSVRNIKDQNNGAFAY